MFTCKCGQPVRAKYCPDDNVHYPEGDCQDCHELKFDNELHKAFILEERKSLKRKLQLLETRAMLEEDMVSLTSTLAQVNEELTKLTDLKIQSVEIEDELPF